MVDNCEEDDTIPKFSAITDFDSPIGINLFPVSHSALALLLSLTCINL